MNKKDIFFMILLVIFAAIGSYIVSMPYTSDPINRNTTDLNENDKIKLNNVIEKSKKYYLNNDSRFYLSYNKNNNTHLIKYNKNGKYYHLKYLINEKLNFEVINNGKYSFYKKNNSIRVYKGESKNIFLENILKDYDISKNKLELNSNNIITSIDGVNDINFKNYISRDVEIPSWYEEKNFVKDKGLFVNKFIDNNFMIFSLDNNYKFEKINYYYFNNTSKYSYNKSSTFTISNPKIITISNNSLIVSDEFSKSFKGSSKKISLEFVYNDYLYPEKDSEIHRFN